jgi:hypothetical protein
MRDVMAKFPGFTEWYEVVNTVSVRLNGILYRLEIIRRFNRQLQSAYDALLWMGAVGSEPVQEWEHLVRDTSFPWVAQDTAEGALEQALALLHQRRRSSPPKESAQIKKSRPRPRKKKS